MIQVMDELAGKVEQWRRAGLVDAGTAERILEYERTAHAGDEPGSGERPGVVEAFIYLGLLVLAIGVFSIAASAWEELESWARVALIGLPAGLALVLGLALRVSDEAAVRRGGQMAWFVSVALVAGLVLVLGEEYGAGVDSPGVRLTAGTATFVYALILWVIWPSHLQIVAVGGALAFFAQMLGSWPDEFNSRLAGLGLLVPSVGAVALAESRQLPPRITAKLVFAVTLVAGGLEMQADSAWYWEPWGIVAGAALVTLSLRRGTFTYMVVGMGAIFIGLVIAVGEHIAEQVGAQLAFTVTGAFIIAGALIVAELTRRFGPGRR